MKKKREQSKKSARPAVRGIVIPAKWDNNGNVVGVSIHTFDEREYIVKPYKLGKELLQFVNQTVSVIGTVSERLDGKLIIEVSHFEVINRIDDIQDAAFSEE